MKKTIAALAAMLLMALSASSMSYEQARREALFLTDKMAYELNLTAEQYDAAYEINLDYLMDVTSVDNVFSDCWMQRNLDMSYILLSWQWDAFCAATYFYRPLYWLDGYWHFAIYARYPRRDYFYFSHPTVYVSYRGGHSWRSNGGRSYYHSHRSTFQAVKPRDHGMRTLWDNGKLKGNRAGANSSTRVTVKGSGSQSSGSSSRQQGSFRNNRTTTTSGTGSSSSSRQTGTSTTSGSFRSQRTGSTSTTSGTSTRRTSSGTSSAKGSFSTSRTTGTSVRSTSSGSSSSSSSRSGTSASSKSSSSSRSGSTNSSGSFRNSR